MPKIEYYRHNIENDRIDYTLVDGRRPSYHTHFLRSDPMYLKRLYDEIYVPKAKEFIRSCYKENPIDMFLMFGKYDEIDQDFTPRELLELLNDTLRDKFYSIYHIPPIEDNGTNFVYKIGATRLCNRLFNMRECSREVSMYVKHQQNDLIKKLFYDLTSTNPNDLFGVFIQCIKKLIKDSIVTSLNIDPMMVKEIVPYRLSNRKYSHLFTPNLEHIDSSKLIELCPEFYHSYGEYQRPLKDPQNTEHPKFLGNAILSLLDYIYNMNIMDFKSSCYDHTILSYKNFCKEMTNKIVGGINACKVVYIDDTGTYRTQLLLKNDPFDKSFTYKAIFDRSKMFTCADYHIMFSASSHDTEELADHTIYKLDPWTKEVYDRRIQNLISKIQRSYINKILPKPRNKPMEDIRSTVDPNIPYGHSDPIFTVISSFLYFLIHNRNLKHEVELVELQKKKYTIPRIQNYAHFRIGAFELDSEVFEAHTFPLDTKTSILSLGLPIMYDIGYYINNIFKPIGVSRQTAYIKLDLHRTRQKCKYEIMDIVEPTTGDPMFTPKLSGYLANINPSKFVYYDINHSDRSISDEDLQEINRQILKDLATFLTDKLHAVHKAIYRLFYFYDLVITPNHVRYAPTYEYPHMEENSYIPFNGNIDDFVTEIEHIYETKLYLTKMTDSIL